MLQDGQAWKTFMPTKGSQSRKTTQHMIPFNEMLSTGKSTETK